MEPTPSRPDCSSAATLAPMFDALTGRLNGVFDRLRGKGRLGEKDVDAALREVRMALLEADVNVGVAKAMLGRVRERALGTEVAKSLTPGQQVVKIVHEELITTLGSVAVPLASASKPPLTFLLVGLQGSGKTTTAAKLARRLSSSGKRTLLVAADLQRPAAIDQLETLGASIGVPVHVDRTSTAPRVVKAGMKRAAVEGFDTRPGRLQCCFRVPRTDRDHRPRLLQNGW